MQELSLKQRKKAYQLNLLFNTTLRSGAIGSNVVQKEIINL